MLERMGIFLHDVMSLKLNKIPKVHLSSATWPGLEQESIYSAVY